MKLTNTTNEFIGLPDNSCDVDVIVDDRIGVLFGRQPNLPPAGDDVT